MQKTEKMSFKVLPRDKEAIERLAEREGEPMAVLMRRLIRNEAQRHGLLATQPPPDAGR